MSVSPCAVELHAFALANAPTLGPIVFITVAGDARVSGAADVFCTSASIKKQLAHLLDLRLSTLKFCTEIGLNRLLKQGTLQALPTPILLDSKLRPDKIYDCTWPPILAESMKRHDITSSKIVSGLQLHSRLGAIWLAENDPLSNLMQFSKFASGVVEGLNERTLHCTLLSRCVGCNTSFPIPGSRRPFGSPQRCSQCRGDPEGMRAITRKVLALRFGGGVDEWQSMRSRLIRAVKAGHAEAVRAIALASNRNRVLSVVELDLAIRSRRAGVVSIVLSCCSLDVVKSCLKVAEAQAVASDTFGGEIENSEFFNDIRRRLLEVHALLGRDGNPFEEQHRMGWLVMFRHGVQALPRQRMLEFLSSGFSAMICEHLSEMLAGLDGLEIRIYGKDAKP
jgi:hypothetical protein